MKNVNKYNIYILPSILLLLCISISIIISFISDKSLDVEKKITIALSFLGIGYAVFQFWVTEINTERRRKYDLMFLNYREISDEIHKTIELFTTDLPYNKCIDYENFYSSVLSISNRILVHIDILNNLVFRGIKNKNECDIFYSSLTEIVKETEEFRNYMLRNKNWDESTKQLHQDNWTTKMNPILKKYNDSINNFQYMLQTYF